MTFIKSMWSFMIALSKSDFTPHRWTPNHRCLTLNPNQRVRSAGLVSGTLEKGGKDELQTCQVYNLSSPLFFTLERLGTRMYTQPATLARHEVVNT
jgi:hypothetical protein